MKPEWLDDNRILRNAYVPLIFSLATDAFMDRIGIDAAYRARTACTLYTLESHLHFLRQVAATDVVKVDAHILDFDKKRIHLALELRVANSADVVAASEWVLLHVHQGDKPAAASLAAEVERAIVEFRAADTAEPWQGPRSRTITVENA